MQHAGEWSIASVNVEMEALAIKQQLQVTNFAANQREAKIRQRPLIFMQLLFKI